MNSFIKILVIALAGSTLAGCNKFVDIEPKGQLIPTTTEHFRMLLDFVQKINFTGSIGELASDNMYYSDLEFQQISNTFEKNTYTWGNTIYLPSDQATDWNVPYTRVYTANVILEGLTKIADGNEKKTLMGEALFHRGMALFEVVRLYAGAYNTATAATDKGVPVRLSSDVFEVSARPSLKATYDQILDDLSTAVELLPARSEYKTRASKITGYAVLARVYLEMENYDKCLESCLKLLELQPTLIDYNDIDINSSPHFPEFNAEVIMHLTVPNFAYSFDFNLPIDEQLYNLYDDNDLRKTLFFRVFDPGTGVNSVSFEGSYSGYWQRFTGLATDEIYLTVAECYLRAKNIPKSLDYLNALLVKRYLRGEYTPFQSSDETVILKKIIQERRKELVGRNSRWFDLKRYNRDSRLAVTLERSVQAKTYRLPPNDARYVFPIPQTVIDATGMEQNVR